MLPPNATNDATNGHLSDSELARKSLLAYSALGVEPTDFSNLLFGQTSLGVPFASAATPLLSPIPVVLEGITKPQMVWSDTRRVIARVQNTRAFREHAPRVIEFPSKMGSAFVDDLLATGGYKDPAIAILVQQAGPDPAFVRSLFPDFGPKTGEVIATDKLDEGWVTVAFPSGPMEIAPATSIDAAGAILYRTGHRGSIQGFSLHRQTQSDRAEEAQSIRPGVGVN